LDLLAVQSIRWQSLQWAQTTVGKESAEYHSFSFFYFQCAYLRYVSRCLLDAPRALLQYLRQRCTAIFYDSRSAFSAASYRWKADDWRNSFGLALHCTGSIRNYHFEAGLANGIAMAPIEERSCWINLAKLVASALPANTEFSTFN
jgi:hypothetical protein